jgi:hypothetical protein
VCFNVFRLGDPPLDPRGFELNSFISFPPLSLQINFRLGKVEQFVDHLNKV